MLGIVKLLFLAALVILGIVLLPQGWVDEAKDAFAGARSYLSQTIKERSPEVKENIASQAEETQKEAQIIYEGFKGEKWPQIKDWLVKKFIY